MARKSLIARNEKRMRLAEKYAKKRTELKERGDWEGLQKLPRNSCPVRIRNRCFITGRSRGYLRQFGMSRICLREQAAKGHVPGLRKSSW
ncbi:MAG: 30S ribosomal protein S14 [Candidatus Kaiserbacteria bacterium]|nr:30S ribosomal protein S14 [Candidatus Kaiserbacteria bacterium]